jgi:hypothetical protein
MRRLILLLLMLATPAAAEESRLRLLGEAAAPGSVAPSRFVIDAVLEDGYAPLTLTIDEGWLASLDGGDEPKAQGELDGSCVDGRCAFSVDHDGGKLIITGDLVGPGPRQGKFTLQDGEEAVVAQGPVRFTPLADTVPGVGRIAEPAAITGAALSELLLWTGHRSGFFSIDDDPPDDFQRDALVAWQMETGRLPTGLILVDDLAALRAQVARARADAGWTQSGAGGVHYPGAWLRSLSVASSPTERRFASEDGKVRLVIAVDPPMTDDAWDAMVDQLTDDRSAGQSNGYTRVNDDMEITRTKDGVVTSSAFKSTDKGFYRLALSYPEDQEGRWAPMAAILQYDLRRAGAGH